jgi:hypothetical protein
MHQEGRVEESEDAKTCVHFDMCVGKTGDDAEEIC